MSHDTSSFFGAVIPAVKFAKIGDAITGKVIDKEIRQQTDLESGIPQTWTDGRPKMMAVLTLECMESTPDEDGLRNLYVRGYMQVAMRAACQKAHLRDIENGDWVTVAWTGEDTPTRRGVNGAKRYTAEVVPKSESEGMSYFYTDPDQDTEESGEPPF